MSENKLIRYSTEIKIVQSSVKKLNPQFSLCDILVCYHGDNRNWTSLSKNVIEENLYSIYGIPIIGEWIYKMDDANEQTWGSHGGRVIIDDQGFRFEQTTKPYGFVTKEAAENASWVTITEKDGHTEHEYLKLSGCILWTDRYEEASTILDENFGQSMEIEISDGNYREDNYFDIKKFVFSALCILGTDCEPCFEGACIGRHYELDTFKQEFTTMLDEYTKFQNETMKGEETMDLIKFTEALSEISFKTDADEEVCKYRLLNVTDSKVFVLDMEDYKPYGFNYAMITGEDETENLVIDFESKTEMSLSATDKITDEDFVEFSIMDEIDSIKKAIFDVELPKKVNETAKILEDNFEAKFNEMNDAYNTLAASYQVAMKRLEEYDKKEADEKAKQHEEAVNALFDEYSEKLGKCSEFLIYKAKTIPAEVTLDEVRENLTLMAGKFMMSDRSKKNFSYKPTEAGVMNGRHSEISSRYGHLLDKYIK